ncbi:MAG: hypothetical protein ACKVZJ_02750 [Phycisphaerales bacterium]
MMTNERTPAGPEEAQNRLDRLRPSIGPLRALPAAGRPQVIIERRPTTAPDLDGHASRVFDEMMGHSTRDTRGEVSEPVN